MVDQKTYDVKTLRNDPGLLDNLRRFGGEVSIDIPGYSRHYGRIVYVREAGGYYLKSGSLLYPLGIWD